MKGVFSYLAVVAMSVGLVSCGDTTPVGNETVKFGESNIIVGSVDWREVTELSDAHPFRVSSRAVADVQFSNGGRCTGFLISDNVLMTNQHCITKASDVVGMKVYMQHEKGVAKSQWKEIKCNEFIGNDYALDFALAKCEGTPGQDFGKVELDTQEAQVGEDVYVVHQNCDYYTQRDCDWSKKYSQGKVVDVGEEVGHDADTLGGSSGSPVFSQDSNKVVAIHHAGYGGNMWGRGVKNTGVPMSRIVPFIQAKFPGVLESASDTDEPSDDDTQGDDNDSFSSATALGSKADVDASIDSEEDMDFYKVEMKKGEIFDFKIFFKHAHGDLDFYVYKQVGSSVKYIKKKESSSDNESIRMRVSSTTTYYVKVFGYKGDMADYQVVFTKK